MVAVMRPDVPQEKIDHLISWLQDKGLEVYFSRGAFQSVLGLVGDTSEIDMDMLRSLDIVESVTRVSDPFKACNRRFHPEDTMITTMGGKGPSIGDGHFALIAGPCSVESREQLTSIAVDIKAAGANFLRGGAFKPRTSPYDFQGLGQEGLNYLLEAKKATGLPIVTELMLSLIHI